MTQSNELTRRKFIHQAAAVGAGGTAAYFIPGSALGKNDKAPASERIQVALIGCGGMGSANLGACAGQPDVVVTAVCDVWKTRRERAAASYRTAKPYHDYREVLQQKTVDGVIIGTPPHWHCRMAVDACEAGKDLYLQKPMTLHVGESLAVKNAVKKHQRICQIGTQIHAGGNYRRVVEAIRAGNLGKISSVQTFNVMNQGPGGIGNTPNCEPPKEIDWNFWVGPYPMQPFNPLIVKDAYENCSFMALSGGWTPGMAPHIVDLPVWALELGYPTTTFSAGGRFTIKDAGDSPDVQEVLWQYPGVTMSWRMSMVNSFGFDFGRGKSARRLGIYFHGTNGTLYSDYGSHQIVPEGERMKGVKPPAATIPPSPGHEREWLDAIKSRKQPSCCPDYHGKIDVALCLANLSLRLGRALRFDPQTEKIVGDAEAAKLAVPEYRDPWKFPAQYL